MLFFVFFFCKLLQRKCQSAGGWAPLLVTTFNQATNMLYIKDVERQGLLILFVCCWKDFDHQHRRAAAVVRNWRGHQVAQGLNFPHLCTILLPLLLFIIFSSLHNLASFFFPFSYFSSLFSSMTTSYSFPMFK